MRTGVIVAACLTAAIVVVIVAALIIYKYKKIKRKESKTGEERKRWSFKEWLIAHRPSKRRLIQVYAALLYNANVKGYVTGSIYTGGSKVLCVPGLNCYSCPGAIGACPLGALQNALAESSVRAPYHIIGILALFGIIFARTICGWLCPIGLGQELLYKFRTPKMKKNRITRVMSYFKYVILFILVVVIPLLYALRDVPLPAFCKYICPAGTIGGAIALLFHPNNAAMFDMLGPQFLWKLAILIVFIVSSIFIYRFFCRFFCPLGAIYGFFNKIALLGVKVDKEKCTDCGKCVSVCQMDIKRVGDHECIHCGRCVSVCSAQAIRWKGSKLFTQSAKCETNSAVCGETSVAYEGLSIRDESGGDDIKSTFDEKIYKLKIDKDCHNFWIRFTAYFLAVCVLVGAFVYYNFLAEDKSNNADAEIGYEVGMLAPNFTVNTYGSDEKFTLYENRGSFTVINFWATWCTPCVAEIPYFDRLAAEKNEVSVIAIHGYSTRDVGEFIGKNWPNHSLLFAQDNLSGSKCLTYQLLGGSSMWPMTVMVDTEGKIVYNSTQSFKSYEQLEQLVWGFL